MKERELLQYALEHGMINVSYVQEQIEMNKRKELLKKHTYSVWQGKDGKWYTKFPDEEKGKIMKKRNTREEIENLICDFWEKKSENPDLKEVFQLWISKKVEYKEIQKGSADRYSTDFERFFVKTDFSKRKIKSIREDELEEFIRKQIAENELTAKSFSGLRIITKGIFKYAKKRKWTQISISEFFLDLDISKNSFKKVVREKEKEVLSEDEIPILINYLKKSESLWDLGVLLALQTGLRVGELSTLRCGDWSGVLLKIRREEGREKDESGKTIIFVKEFTKTEAGIRDVILNSGGIETLEKIVSINPNGKYLFENFKGKRILGNTFNKHLDIVLRRLNLPHRSMHKLRKTYCTMLINSGCDDSLIMQQMGHSSIDTSRKYYYYANRNIENQMKQIEMAVMK